MSSLLNFLNPDPGKDLKLLSENSGSKIVIGGNGVLIETVTDAVSSTDGGSITVVGGAAIGKRLFVGTSLSVGTSTSTGTLTTDGGASVGTSLSVGTSTNTGTLTTTGSASVGTDLTVGSSTSTDTLSTTGSVSIGTDLSVGTSTNTGTLATTGSASVGTSLSVGTSTSTGTLTTTGSTASTSTATGAIVTPGGIGISNTTDAVSSTNGGTITTAGGAAIGKKLFVGTDLSVGTSTSTGTLTTTGSASVGTSLSVGTSTITGTLNTTGGASVGTDLTVGSSTSTGTLITTGSVSVGTSLSVGTSTSTGTLTTSGSANVGTGLAVGTSTNTGTLTTTGSTASTSTGTGAITTPGGIGISNTTDAVSSTNGGTITTAGGVAIGKKLFVGTDLSVGISTSTGTLTTAGSASVGTGLTVGTSTSTGTLSTTGSASIGTGLTVGTSTSTGTLITTGSASVGTDLSVGTSTNTGTLATTGSVSVGTSLSVGTSTSTGTLTTSGSASVGTGLAVGTSTNTGTLTTTGSTASTSTGTGAITTPGGIGISNITDAVSSTNGGTITTAGGAAVGKKLFVGTDLSVGTSTSTGTLSTTGGASVGTDLTVGSSTSTGTLSTAGSASIGTGLTVGTSTSTGTLSTTGSASIGTGLTVGTSTSTGTLTTTGSTASTSTNTGAITTPGGIGISNTTDAVSSTNGGTITTAGGAAIGKKLFVGTDLSVLGTTTGTNVVSYTVNSDNVFSVNSGSRTANTAVARFLSPSLSVGNYTLSRNGVGDSTNNSFETRFYNVGPGSSANYLSFAPFQGTQVLNILTNGNVGIGTTSPVGRLHINGGQTDITTNIDNSFRVDSGTRTPNTTTARFLSPSLGSGNYTTLAIGTAQTTNNSFETRFYNIGAGSISNRLSFSPLGGGEILSVLAGGSVGVKTSRSISNTVASLGVGNLGINLQESLGTAGSFSIVLGFNTSFDGTNWNFLGDGTNNGGAAILGNYGTNSSIRFLVSETSGGIDRTLTNSLFQATEKMTILSNGNVGIGTDTPQAPLHIRGTVLTVPSLPGVFLSGDDGGGNSFVMMNAGSATTGTTYIDFGYPNVDYRGRIQYINNTDQMRFETAASSKMVINSNGNVGIGTDIPSLKMSVSSANPEDIVLLHNTNSLGYATIQYRNNNNLIYYTGVGGTTVPNGLANNFYINTPDGVTRILINQSGNVGIGTINPGTILDVSRILDGETSMRITNSSSGVNALSSVRISNNVNTGILFLNSSTRTADGGINTMTVRNDAGALRLQSNGASGIHIRAANGFCGFGNVTDAQAAIHVSGVNTTVVSPNTNGIFIGQDPSANSSIQLNSGAAGTGASYIDFGYPNVDYRGRIIYFNTTEEMSFETSALSRLRLTSDNQAIFTGNIVTKAGTGAGGEAGIAHYRFQTNSTERFAIGLGNSETGSNSGSDLRFFNYADNGAFLGTVMTITRSNSNVSMAGNLSVAGSVSKGGGTFNIPHPLLEGIRLVHSFVEGPRCDLIYRGTVKLVNGKAEVNIDEDCTEDPLNSMTQGTFEALCKNPVKYLHNNDSFSRIRGSIAGNILTIVCEDPESEDSVDWMVIAERKDAFVRKWEHTDISGSLVTEYIDDTGI